jgi:hypothetical protein
MIDLPPLDGRVKPGHLEQIPPKLLDFGDKDLLQIALARIPFGEVIPLRQDAR